MIDAIVMKLIRAFPNSFINGNGEFIAHREANTYFKLIDCKGEFEVKCKVLEWFSRGAYKTQPFGSKKKNDTYNKFMLDGINKFLDTSFSNKDMKLIYQELGNQVDRRLTNLFISNDYDLDILREGR